MRNHSLLIFACYGVTVVLLWLPGTWSAPLNATEHGFGFSPLDEKSPRSSPMKRGITVSSDCVGTWLTSVNSAKAEALDIVRLDIP